MNLFPLLAVVIVVAVFGGFALVIAIIVFAGRPRPQPGLGASTGSGPVGAGAVSGTWNGQILGSNGLGALGGTLGSTFGTFRVADGALAFDAAGEGSWQLPCGQVTARKQTLLSIGAVGLGTPRGEIRCNVSREHINAFSRNDIKSMRQRRYADEFIGVLAANGARVSG